ncbi:MAG: hypothetical protein IKK27_07525, partial [Alistipes sp.]|nr:hypothetical protein [Alistipes sp.]
MQRYDKFLSLQIFEPFFRKKVSISPSRATFISIYACFWKQLTTFVPTHHKHKKDVTIYTHPLRDSTPRFRKHREGYQAGKRY